MGLPIFCNLADFARSPKPAPPEKTDSTARARSSIRRRPSIHRGGIPRPPQRWPVSSVQQGRLSPPPPLSSNTLPPVPDSNTLRQFVNEFNESGRDRLPFGVVRLQRSDADEFDGNTSDGVQDNLPPVPASQAEVEAPGVFSRDLRGSDRTSILPTPPLEVSRPAETEPVGRHSNRTPSGSGLPFIYSQRVTGPWAIEFDDSSEDARLHSWEASVADSLRDIRWSRVYRPPSSLERTSLPDPRENNVSLSLSEDVDLTLGDLLTGSSDRRALTREPDTICLSDSDTDSTSMNSSRYRASELRSNRQHDRLRRARARVADRINLSALNRSTSTSDLVQDHIRVARRALQEDQSASSLLHPDPADPDRYDPYIRARSRNAAQETRQYFHASRARALDASRAHSDNPDRWERTLSAVSDDLLGSGPIRRTLLRERSEISRARDSMRESASQLERLSRTLVNVDVDTAGTGATSAERYNELEPLRDILERLSRRQDIPDEWWMSAGLSRDVVRGATTTREDSGNASGTEASESVAPMPRRTQSRIIDGPVYPRGDAIWQFELFDYVSGTVTNRFSAAVQRAERQIIDLRRSRAQFRNWLLN